MKTSNKNKELFFLIPRKLYRLGKKIPCMEPILFQAAQLFFLFVSNFLLIFKKRKYREQLKEILKKNKNRKGIIVYPSPIDWDFTLFQRPHQFAICFAKKKYLFFFCTSSYTRKGFYKIDENLYMCGRDLLNILSEIPIDILFITPKFDMIDLSEKYIFKNLIYDYIDDLSVWAWGETKQGRIAHEYMVQNADLIITSATQLYREIKEKGKNAVLSPNGVDYNHFHKNVFKLKLKTLFKIKKDKPVIGFYGGLADWIDYELIYYIAQKNKNFLIILIGLDMGGFIKRYSLNKLDNVLFIGPRDYKVLPEYLKYFDVAIIPFKVNKISKATSPIKLFEYMAAGKPVVTTNMPECKKYKGIFVSYSYEEFNQNIYKALKKSKSKNYKNSLTSQAFQNTWEKRVDVILNALNT